MSRALGPRPPLAAGNAAIAWTLIIIFWGLAGLAWLAGAAARLAAAAAGAGIPPFSVHWVSALLPGRTALAWPGTRHPGRGKYLIKTGQRLGIPVELSLVGAEHALYDTDQAIRAEQPWWPR